MLNHISNFMNDAKNGLKVTQRAIHGDVKAGQQVLTVVGDACINIVLGTSTLAVLNALVSSPICTTLTLPETENCPLDEIIDLQAITIASFIGSLGLIAKFAVFHSRLDERLNASARQPVSFSNCPINRVLSTTTATETAAFLAAKYLFKKLG